jgi:transposase
MPKVLEVQGDLSLSELYQRYRESKDAISKTHWQILWLKAQKTKTLTIATMTGYNPDWVRQIIRRYNELGTAGIGDRRRYNGTEPMLTTEQQEALRQALAQRAPDGGLWNCRKVALWIESRIGHPVHPQTGWEYLQRAKMSLQVPRPKHPETTPASIEAFKKNSRRP